MHFPRGCRAAGHRRRVIWLLRLRCFAATQARESAGEARFGINQELTGEDNTLTFFDAVENLRLAASLVSRTDFLCAEAAFAVVDDDDVACARCDHCFSRNQYVWDTLAA